MLERISGFLAGEEAALGVSAGASAALKEEARATEEAAFLKKQRKKSAAHAHPPLPRAPRPRLRTPKRRVSSPAASWGAVEPWLWRPQNEVFSILSQQAPPCATATWWTPPARTPTSLAGPGPALLGNHLLQLMGCAPVFRAMRNTGQCWGWGCPWPRCLCWPVGRR